MKSGLSVAVGQPTDVPHDSEVDHAQDGYLRIRNRLEHIPHLALTIIQ
jgi:hypothetical protein